MYDIFYVSRDEGSDDNWKKIKSKYPIAQRLSNIKTYDSVRSRAFTKMFWVIWDDLEISDTVDLLEYKATKWDDKYVHVFKNGEYYDGICLFPKSLNISQREFDHRFFTNKKEIDIVASNPRLFDKFKIVTYDDYKSACDNSVTDMFWAVWDDVIVCNNFQFDYQIPSYNRNLVHIFKNGEYYDGICLFPKSTIVSKKEFDHRFFTNKKEIDIVASHPKKYNIYSPVSYEEYLKIKDDLFWIVWNNIRVCDNSLFDTYFSYHDIYHRKENHIYKNSCNGKESYINGIFLCSRQKKISKREFDTRYLIDKKEHNIVASKSQYPIFKINTYDDYLDAIANTSDAMFWAIYPEIEITDQSVFDFYFDPRDGKYDYDRNINHVFLHKFKDEYNFNGLMLMSVQNKVGKREIDFRYLINKKEHEIIASQHRLYDIVFISYNEPNADENWNKLKIKYPRAKRIDKVKGIHQAHIRAAEICETEMFWVVDADAVILDNFDFTHVVTRYERKIVHVWRSQNPINGLVYGYGGVKLLPRQLTLQMNTDSADMTTSISDQFKVIEEVSNLTVFNTDSFNTWKSAFRECVKLSAKLISRQNDDETNERLEIWCNQGKDKLYGEYAIAGAIAGREFGLAAKNNQTELAKINDFEWLRKKFDGI